METKFIGEHLFPGQFGHFFAVLSLVASLVALVSYFNATRAADEATRASWNRMGRITFVIQALSVFVVFGSLYYILQQHYFEYKYAYRNSSRNMLQAYLFSSFWSDQEGSFLLWSVWQSVLGLILIRKAKSWENPVLTVMSFAQFCLATMLIGIYFFGYRVGANPFELLRQTEPYNAAPVFQTANYLADYVPDGNGLNPLLQNYWMVIHPPVLFLGFASTIVPFAFAFAGLWTRRFSEWVKPALPWALFSAMILGTGIMMGAAWAYESLTFGGYWAWDPVENASLVPWLTLVAGIHTLLAYKSTGQSLKITFFFFFITFVLILYSTFLTRSGILGDTSVHAFTDLGMTQQLLYFMLAFLIPAFGLMIYHRKRIPSVHKEESTYSREFWMFVGSLVLLMAAIQITFTTSIPVWNKVLNGLGLMKLFNMKDLAPPLEPVFHYNKIQIWIAIVLGVLTAVIQYLKYKETPKGYTWRNIWLPTALAALATLLIGVFGKIDYDHYGTGFLVAIYIMLYASVYAVVANVHYIVGVLKGNFKAAGASIAHIGFGLVLLGVLISSSKKQVISLDQMNILDGYFGKDSKENSRENLMLPLNMPMQMGDYHVTYVGDSVVPGDFKTYYRVRYVKVDKDGKITEQFTLYPDAFVNRKMAQASLVANPSSKHYLTKDIFTYLTSLPDPDAYKDTAQYVPHDVKPGDSIFFSQGYMVLKNIQPRPETKNYKPQGNDIAVSAKLEVHSLTNDELYHLEPVYLIRDSAYQYSVEDTVSAMSLYVRFDKLTPTSDNQARIQLQVKDAGGAQKNYIVLKAMVFPYINVLWIGVLVMILGFFLSIIQRVKQNRRTEKAMTQRKAKEVSA
ncbi:cytochrome c assembly protein [Chitinophaga parva]|uniref:Cytochrome c assembly protein n=1 Tax=Chitinophaga parva TaxID=2169414 RepID=A0A2T7BIB1_9BACT|nr:cytochrome c biogenesis protein CcsA [Chitinophaga parva]PUZ26008.1 cytochrome c assembly protein [Chitinophaga parva]